eukprot:scaffold56_cov390-Pavlova_lutheri.AAC.19
MIEVRVPRRIYLQITCPFQPFAHTLYIRTFGNKGERPIQKKADAPFLHATAFVAGDQNARSIDKFEKSEPPRTIGSTKCKKQGVDFGYVRGLPPS